MLSPVHDMKTESPARAACYLAGLHFYSRAALEQTLNKLFCLVGWLAVCLAGEMAAAASGLVVS